MAVKRVKFEPQMSVIRVRKQYAAPYLKYRYVYITSKHVRSEKNFKQYMNEIVPTWPPGIYYLKLSTGKVFVKFKIDEGRVTNIYRTSPITGEKYPIWGYIKR